MDLKDEFFSRLNRAHNRAQTTARGSTLNKQAWLEQANDIAVIRRLASELGLFAESTELKAEARYAAALEQEETDIDQAEDLANAKTIADNAGLFVANDVGTIRLLLEQFDPVVFEAAWLKLPKVRQEQLLRRINKANE